MGWLKLVGKKVDTVRGHVLDKRVKRGIDAEYVLFTDKKTIMKLERQDYYSYHDCSGSAREINIYESKEMWKRIKGDIKTYPKVREDI